MRLSNLAFQSCVAKTCSNVGRNFQCSFPVHVSLVWYVDLCAVGLRLQSRSLVANARLTKKKTRNLQRKNFVHRSSQSYFADLSWISALCTSVRPVVVGTHSPMSMMAPLAMAFSIDLLAVSIGATVHAPSCSLEEERAPRPLPTAKSVDLRCLPRGILRPHSVQYIGYSDFLFFFFFCLFLRFGLHVRKRRRFG